MTLFSLARLAAMGLVLCRLSLTMPTDLTVRTTSPEVIYDFDELPPAVAVTGLTPVGRYHDLDFNLQLTSLGIDGSQPSGLTLPSGSNGITFSFRGEVIAGEPEIKIPGGGVGATSFILTSLYLGCETATAQELAQEAVDCTIKVNFFLNGNSVGFRDKTFTPTKVSSPLQKFTFPLSIGPVDSINFTTVVATGTQVTTGVTIDSIGFIIYE